MMEVPPINLLSRERIFPSSRSKSSNPQTVPLSVLDAAVAYFPSASGSWIFDRPHEEKVQQALSIESLCRSLREVLNSYPQWAGQLHWAPYNLNGGHTQRFRRLMLTYGAETDPGVELAIAHCPASLSSIVPDADGRRADNGCYDANQFSQLEVVSTSIPLALHNRTDYEGLPILIVQLTTFECGGISICTKFHHSIADAQTMINFVRDWAAVNRAMAAELEPPKFAHIYNPFELDNAAAGDIDTPKPDTELVQIAKSLPLHHYDYWASANGCPTWALPETEIPSALDPNTIEKFGTPLPWSTWDLSKPVSTYLIHFASQEIENMKLEAAKELGGVRVSHMDVLLSHVCGMIYRARGLQQDPEQVNLDVTFGFRQRVVPALSNNFMGSPITQAAVQMSGIDACDTLLGKRAVLIRSTLGKLNSSTIPALLHYYNHQVCAQRLWNTFLGQRTILFTSWHRQDIYNIEFATGATARCIGSHMPASDGCLQIMEADKSASGDTASSHWYDGGVSINLSLTTEAMNKLLKDPLLRKYKS
ncbi:hypothetical protein INT43_008342 [Umbelopsis isabellina]|uniref:Transferase n=1 Tax=Mortierella isabellina TaxID=91625 RepID=A0A8H7PDZ3_MORIS|nr:hypothetical protein INT43_008342 [Umbelopsis isabellina]